MMLDLPSALKRLDTGSLRVVWLRHGGRRLRIEPAALRLIAVASSVTFVMRRVD
jgi:hypothetical protein